MAEQDKAQQQDQLQESGGEQAEQQDQLPPVEVGVEEVGPLKKKLTITVPQERVDARRNETVKQLRQTAQVPGFRVGRAPRRLIEKRFGTELTQDVKTNLVAEGYQQAIEKAELKVLGEPDMTQEKLDAIELPESGPLSFEVEVEVQPDFTLPELKEIPVTRPKVEVTEESVDAELERIRMNFAKLETIQEPAAADDVVQADFVFEPEGGEKHSHKDMQFAVRGQAIEGVPLENLGDKLAGVKAGDSVTVEATIPDSHAKEELRGKKATFTFDIKKVSRIVKPELNDEFGARFGFDKLADVRTWVRERLEVQTDQFQRRQMRQQVLDYLNKNVDLELPAGVLGRMKDRALVRRANEMMMQGVPQTELEKQIDRLEVEAGEQAAAELKNLFIMQRVADELKVEVTPDEVNGFISQMAAYYNRRPDNVREELQQRGGIEQLYQQIQEQKAVDRLLDMAKVTDESGTPEAEAEAKK